MDTLASRSSNHVAEYRKGQCDEPLQQQNTQDPSYFYRTPRSRTTTPMPRTPRQSTHPWSPSSAPSSTSENVEETRFNMNSALSQVSPMDGVDYSFREVDLYYGINAEGRGSGIVSNSGPSSTSEPDQPTDNTVLSKRKFKLALRLGRPKQKEPNKGFEVVRRQRPPL